MSRGPLAARLWPVGSLAGAICEPAYRAAVAWRNRRYDRGVGVRALPVPVVSVGNLTVGGTGKSPMVAHLARAIARMGFRPAIALRGYAARGGHSDEAEEYRATLPGVPLAVGADRHRAVAAMFATPEGRGAECVILDDGFQHRAVKRDLDVVLIDATRDVVANRLLPAGWLREPFESLRRAHAVVLTHMEAADERLTDRLIHRVRAVMGPVDPMRCRHEWGGLDGLTGGEGETTVWLRGRRVVAVCAIGNPGPFLAALRREVGGPLAGEVVLGDHHPLGVSAVRGIVARAEACGAAAVVCTNKDWAKLARVPADTWPCPVVRPRLRLRFESGEDRLMALLGGVLRRERPGGHLADDSTVAGVAGAGRWRGADQPDSTSPSRMA